MKIDHLDLIAYGHFKDQKLDLSSGDLGFHVIYGENEAGKSTALRALTAWLFGIPQRTDDNFLYAYEDLRIGGQLRSSTDKTLAFTRKKARHQTLLKYGTQQPLDDDELFAFLPRDMSEESFKRLWGIDYEGLVSGGSELLEDSGDLARALYSAALGVEGVRGIAYGLQEKSNDLFKLRGTNPPLNRAIKAYKEAQAKRDEYTFTAAQWQNLDEKLQGLVVEIKNIEQQIKDQRTEHSRLQRIWNIKEPLARYGRINHDLSAMSQVILLPKDFHLTLGFLRKDLKAAEEGIAEGQDQCALLQKRVAELRVRADLLAKSHEISQLQDDLGAYKKYLRDLPGLRKQAGAKRRDAELRLQQIPTAEQLSDLESWRSLFEQKAKLHELHTDYVSLSQQLKGSQNNRQVIEQAIKDLEEQKKSLYNDTPLPRLQIKATERLARNANHLEESLEQAHRRFEAEHRGCLNDLAQMGRYSGSLENLVELALPSLAALDESEKQYLDLFDEIKGAKRQSKELREDHSKLKRQLGRFTTQNQDIPTLESLRQARDLREDLWQRIKAWLSGEDVKVSSSGSSQDLIQDFEQAARRADHLADRMYADAELVAKKIDLRAQIKEKEARIQERTADLGELQQSMSEFEKSWQEKWSALQVASDSPPVMKSWLTQMHALQKRLQSLADLKEDVARQERLREQHKLDLSAHIKELRPELEVQEEGLDSLRTLLEDLIGEEEKRHQDYERIKRDIKNETRRLSSSQKGHVQLEEQHMSWQVQWQEVLGGSTVAMGLSSEELVEIITALEEIFQLQKEWESFDERIAEAEEGSRVFADRMIILGESLGFDTQQDPLLLAAELVEALKKAQEGQTQLTELRKQIDEWELSIKKKQRQRDESLNGLKKLREQAGVDTDQQLTEAGCSSQAKHELQEKLTGVIEELGRHGGGRSVAELQRELQSVDDVDSLDSEIDGLADELESLQRARDDLRDEKVRLEKDQDAVHGGTQAAEAEEEAAAHAAQIEHHVESYIRLQVASLILTEQIESYRKLNQAPVLKRSSELFSRLTLGSYVGLEDDYEKGKPVLVGIKSHGQKVKTPGMSTGSRDQLFLALRLAMIEQHLGKGEPMPFIVDDILMGFDDARSRVCLEILAELSRQTQVLLFTHHLSVLEMAQSMPSAAGVFCHQLSSRS